MISRFVFIVFSSTILFIQGNEYSAQVRRQLVKPKGECEFDCIRDSDCIGTLNCAQSHSAELKDLGFDEKKAYCGNVGAETDDVCYDPKKLVTCASKTCPENSECVEAGEGGGSQCVCAPGYFKKNKKCKKDPCAGVECPENSQCFRLGNGKTKCKCSKGYKKTKSGMCEKKP